MEKYPPYQLPTLKKETEEIINNFTRNEIDMFKDKLTIEKVTLLLMVVTESEFHAALLYLSKSEDGKQCVLSEKSSYFIGNWGRISAALVKQDQPGITSARKVTCSAIRIFKNLKAIISLGVCGLLSTELKLADVIVPTKIIGYTIMNQDKNLIFSSFDLTHGKNIINFLENNKGSWSFTYVNEFSEKTTKDSISKHKDYKAKAINAPIISGHLNIKNSQLKERLNKDIADSRMAGIEMEGIGISEGIDLEGKEREIEFLVVKAGSDYAIDTSKTQWQAFSAKAAADFVYIQLKSEKATEWFLTGKTSPMCMHLHVLYICCSIIH